MDREYQIIKALGDSESGLSVADLVDATGLSKGMVRDGLRVLAAAGTVQAGLVRGPGPGRPHYRYVLTDGRTSALFELIDMLLDFATIDEESTARLMRVAFETGAARTQGRYPEAMLARAASVGFAPRECTTNADVREGLTRVRLTACPVHDVVRTRNGHIVCGLHRALTSGGCAALGARLVDFTPEDPFTEGCEFTMALDHDELVRHAVRLADMAARSGPAGHDTILDHE